MKSVSGGTGERDISCTADYSLYVCAAIIIVTFVCFLPTLNNQLLIWDDATSILENDHIRHLSFETVRWAFFDFYITTWFPLTWLSLALDYAVWGTNPLGYHLTNNILHTLNVGMFFYILKELLDCYDTLTTSVSRPRKNNTNTNCSVLFCAATAALFYALHPMRVESVAWASERKDVLSLFFGLPAFIAYIKYTRKESAAFNAQLDPFNFVASARYWTAFGFYILSLLSKPTLVTMPLLLLIMDWFPLARFRSSYKMQRLVIEKLPFLGCAVFVSIITGISQKQLIDSNAHLLLTTRILNAFKSIFDYLWFTIWPVNLSTFYLHPGNITTFGLEYSLPIVFFIVVSAVCGFYAKRWPVLLAVWLLYLSALIPVLGFVQTGAQAMASRYTYLASLPIAFLLALICTVIFKKQCQTRQARFVACVVTLMFLGFYVYFTQQHISYWKTDVSLWTRAIDLQPNSIGRAYFQRGAGYMQQGNYRLALEDMNKAVLIASAKRYRDMHTIYLQRARILFQLGDYDGAITDYGLCLKTDTSPARIKYYLERGAIYRLQGKFDRAIEDERMIREINGIKQ